MYEGYDINKEIEAKKVMWLSHGWGGGGGSLKLRSSPQCISFIHTCFPDMFGPWKSDAVYTHIWSTHLNQTI